MKFFSNKTVKTVSLVLFVLSAGSLILGGLTAELLNGALVAVVAAVGAVGALIALIGSLINK